MSLIILAVFAGPILILLGQVAGAAVAFPVVLAFHGIRGLFRRVIFPRLRRAFQ